MPVAGDPARRPDAAARRAGAPGDDLGGVGQADADDPAVIAAAIAEMPAIGDIDPAVEDGERAALVLIGVVEAPALRRQRGGDVDRPARQNGAVLQRHGEDLVARPRSRGDHRVEINRLRPLVDDRRAGDPQRVDIAAWQRRERHRPAQNLGPNDRSRARVDRLDRVAFGGDDQHPRNRSRGLPVERLGIDVPGKARLKTRIEMDPAGLFPAQPRHREIAGALGAAVIAQHRLRMAAAGDRQYRQRRAEPSDQP